MFVFFMVLLPQAVTEREVRRSMAEETIELMPVYSGQILAHHPTTARTVVRSHCIALYRLHYGGRLVNQHRMI